MPDKIINGTTVNICRYSFLASVVTMLTRDRFSFCGGNYLGNKMVLTAAHCIYQERNQTNIRVFFGLDGVDYIKASLSFDEGIKVKDIFVQSEWSPVSFSHDLALLHLSSDPPGFVKPIMLAESTKQAPELFILGYGLTTENDRQGFHQLKMGRVVALNPLEYKAFSKRLDSTMMLAGANESSLSTTDTVGLTDTCHGDSGGPLFYTDENENNVLVGVTSWGYGCGRKSWPGVYSRIYEQLQWIYSIFAKVN